MGKSFMWIIDYSESVITQEKLSLFTGVGGDWKFIVVFGHNLRRFSFLIGARPIRIWGVILGLVSFFAKLFEMLPASDPLSLLRVFSCLTLRIFSPFNMIQSVQLLFYYGKWCHVWD